MRECVILCCVFVVCGFCVVLDLWCVRVLCCIVFCKQVSDEGELAFSQADTLHEEMILAAESESTTSQRV